MDNSYPFSRRMTVIGDSSTKETKWALVLFCITLAFHAWGASVGWKSLNLPGCEFRQTQTALSAYFIQREDNFSLAYPTPVLGKPWSIPMEFPLYQWTVVKFSNVTGVSLTESGRAVSLGCFYLTLPALYLLLLHLGLPPARRLIALGLVLCCPLYIFYARSFLIETMAWMFGSWFLLGYVRAATQKSKLWWLVATLCGVGAGLVKVTTFMAFLIPAFVWTLVWLWQDLRNDSAESRVKTVFWRAVWCLTAVALPLVASVWWVRYSDRIKAESAAGSFLQSAGMAGYNFGVGVRFAPDIWKQHWTILFNEMASLSVLIVCAVIAVVFARRWLGVILALLFFFFSVQVIFPILYAWHEYYYVANAMMLMFAMGIALCGLLESRAPRWLAWLLIVGIYSAQAWGYLSFHYPGQKQYSPGGSDLTVAIRQVTGPDDVMIIVGDDWSSMIPYFAQRRAFMVRRNLEHTWDVIVPAFKALEDEPVTSLVIFNEQRENRDLINMAIQSFDLYPKPVFKWETADVYLKRQVRIEESAKLTNLYGIHLQPDSAQAVDEGTKKEIEVATLMPRYRERFRLMNPTPWKYYTTYGANLSEFAGKTYYAAHPDTKLWFKAAAGVRSMTVQMLMWPEAYTEKIPHWERSDGVVVKITVIKADGSRQEVFSRWINPRDNQADRAEHLLTVDFTLEEAADIELVTSPGPSGNYARDWALFGDIRIR